MGRHRKRSWRKTQDQLENNSPYRHGPDYRPDAAHDSIPLDQYVCSWLDSIPSATGEVGGANHQIQEGTESHHWNPHGLSIVRPQLQRQRSSPAAAACYGNQSELSMLSGSSRDGMSTERPPSLLAMATPPRQRTHDRNSSQLGSIDSHGSKRVYEKQPRRKARPDKYTAKRTQRSMGTTKRRSGPQPRRPQVGRGSKLRSSRDVMDNFTSNAIPDHGIILKPNLRTGLFRNARVAENDHVSDLAFNTFEMPTETDLPTRCTKDRASTRAKESREFGEESTVFLRKGIHYTESTEKDVFSVSSRNVSDVQETKVVAHGEDDCPWDKPGLTENKTPTTPIARASARPKDSREDILNCLLRSSCSPAELTVPQEKHATIPSRTPTPNSIRERLRGTGVFEYREFSGDAALPIPSRDQDNMYSDREPGENSHRRDSEPHTSEARSGPGKASRLNPYHAPSLDKGAQNNITRDVQERQLQKAAHHPRALPAHQYRMAAIDSKPGYLVDTLPRDREEHCFFQDQVYLEFDANRCQGSDVMQNVGDIGKGSMGQRVNAPNPLQRGMSQDQTQHTNRLFQDSTASPNRFFTFPGNLPTVQPLARGYTPTYRQYEAAQAPRGLPSEAEVRQDYMYTLSADSPNLFANLTETIDDVTRNQREGGAREDIHDFIVRNEMELLGTDDLESPWDDSVAYGQPVSSHQLSAPYHEPAIIGYEPSYRNVSSQNRENHPSLCGRIPEYEAQSLGLYRGLGDGMREHNNPVSDRHSRFLEVDMGSFWKPRFY